MATTRGASAGAPLQLLPSKAADFSSQAYWSSFFEQLKQGKDGFEWYSDDYGADVRPLLRGTPLLADVITGGGQGSGKRTLVIGCGNSTLSEDLVADGFGNVVSIDFVPEIIQQMNERARAKKLPLEYLVMDMLHMDPGWTGLVQRSLWTRVP